MKILFDYEIFLAQRHGGISRYFVELIRHLAAQPGCQLTVLAGLHRNDLLDTLRGLPGVRVWGIRLPRWLPGRRPFGLINRMLFPWLARLTRPDIYHATYYRGLAPGLRARRVVTVHDMIHELFPLAANDPTARRKRRAVQRADLVLCVSGHTQQDLIRLLGIPPDKTLVVHHGGSFPGQARAERPLDQPYLLYVGERGHYKNAAVLLEAVASQPDLRNRFQLVFFGGGDWTPAERARLDELGLTQQCRQVGGTDHDLATWYGHAFALVYPSRYEGFGLPPLEAMQFGCPVLASDRSSLREVVGGGGLLVDPEKPDAWAEALLAWVRDPAQRLRFVEAGRVWQRRFTWNACAEKTANAYHALLKNE